MKKVKLKNPTPSAASDRILNCFSSGCRPNPGEELNSALEIAAGALGASAGEISLFDKATGALTFAASCGIGSPQGKTAGRGLRGLARQFLACQKIGGVQSAASIPLSDGGEMIGVLNFYFAEARRISPEDDDFLKVLVKLFSGRIPERTPKNNNSIASQLEIAKVLIKVMEEKDPYTRGHSERVKDYAVKIGEKMKIEGEKQTALSEFSILHDIGKITIDSHILNRPCGLNGKEWELVREHPLTGERIIRSAGGFSSSVPMIRHHHERLDGSGYPDGLKGEEIPLLARIISVCDAFDAMVSKRAYRDALPALTARNELLRNSSRQFDGDITGIMAELIDSGEISILPAPKPYGI